MKVTVGEVQEVQGEGGRASINRQLSPVCWGGGGDKGGGDGWTRAQTLVRKFPAAVR